jgi:aspartate aminotransferase
VNIQKPVSLNLNVRGLGQSATIAINDRSKALAQEGRVVYRLGLGQSPFPVPQPVVNALKTNAHHKEYLPAKGLHELRRAVADFHRRKDGIDAQWQYVQVGPGSKELMFLLQLVYYGELIVPSPCWVSYVPQAKIIGRNVSLIKTHYRDQYRITAERLDYPGNPEGCSYTAGELQDVAEVARKYQVVLLSDEIYGQLHHRGEHVSAARFYPEGTIISSGLSKWCGAGGWRLGTFTFPPGYDWLLDAMAAVASETFTSVSAPIQCAAVRAFQGGVEIERYLWHSRRILSSLGMRCYRMLCENDIRVCPPVGGFYLFLDFEELRDKLAARNINDSTTLCDRLLVETGVAILPGEAFERPREELTARLAYVDFDGASALTASETIPLDQDLPEDFIDTWCHNVITAVKLVIDWARM